MFRHHVEPRVELYSPREESFPIPLKYIDVSRTTHAKLDVKQEKRIDDYWTINGSRDLSDCWTGVTQFVRPGLHKMSRELQICVLCNIFNDDNAQTPPQFHEIFWKKKKKKQKRVGRGKK